LPVSDQNAAARACLSSVDHLRLKVRLGGKVHLALTT